MGQEGDGLHILLEELAGDLREHNGDSHLENRSADDEDEVVDQGVGRHPPGKAGGEEVLEVVQANEFAAEEGGEEIRRELIAREGEVHAHHRQIGGDQEVDDAGQSHDHQHGVLADVVADLRQRMGQNDAADDEENRKATEKSEFFCNHGKYKV